jgi:hypothetical protein
MTPIRSTVKARLPVATLALRCQPPISVSRVSHTIYGEWDDRPRFDGRRCQVFLHFT